MPTDRPRRTARWQIRVVGRACTPLHRPIPLLPLGLADEGVGVDVRLGHAEIAAVARWPFPLALWALSEHRQGPPSARNIVRKLARCYAVAREQRANPSCRAPSLFCLPSLPLSSRAF
jgi:hypothetical protein